MKIHKTVRGLLILFALIGVAVILLNIAGSKWSSYNRETREFIEELAADPERFDDVDLDPLLTSPYSAIPLPNREDVVVVRDEKMGFGIRYYSKPFGPFGIFWVDQREWFYTE